MQKSQLQKLKNVLRELIMLSHVTDGSIQLLLTEDKLKAIMANKEGLEANLLKSVEFNSEVMQYRDSILCSIRNISMVLLGNNTNSKVVNNKGIMDFLAKENEIITAYRSHPLYLLFSNLAKKQAEQDASN